MSDTTYPASLQTTAQRIGNSIKQSIFWSIHIGAIVALFYGVSWIAFGVCIALYFIRMFGITGAYHRYFSHRTYKTSRIFQFVLAFLGCSSAQKGPIWWASHHRHHHKYSDTEHDVHSPRQRGFWWAQVGWILSTQYVDTNYENVKDFMKYPELRWIDQYHMVAPITLAVFVSLLGMWLGAAYPDLHTSGFQMFLWGFCVSTTLLYHGTFVINTLTHMYGSRRFKTEDDSRNSLVLALITMGEGWHNNHHRYPGSEKQGFYWWEIDLSHYVLKILSWMGLVWDLRTPPERIYEEAKLNAAS